MLIINTMNWGCGGGVSYWITDLRGGSSLLSPIQIDASHETLLGSNCSRDKPISKFLDNDKHKSNLQRLFLLLRISVLVH